MSDCSKARPRSRPVALNATGVLVALIPNEPVETFRRLLLKFALGGSASSTGNARSSVESNDSRVTSLYDAILRLTTAALDGLRVFNSSMRTGINL